MKCRAVRDGLMGLSYIHEGETFLADKCPTWAVPVPASVRKGGKAGKSSESEAPVDSDGTPADPEMNGGD